MRFLVDAQLPPALALWIASQPGHEAEHVAFALSPSATDEAIVFYAVAKAEIIVSKDADFLNLVPASTPACRRSREHSEQGFAGRVRGMFRDGGQAARERAASSSSRSAKSASLPMAVAST